MKFVTIKQDKKGIWCATANTGNWAGDFFYLEGKTYEEAKQKLINAIKNDGEELWLLKQQELLGTS